MKTLHPFQIIQLTADEYDKYQGEIKRQHQMLDLINYVIKNEDAVLSMVITDLGIDQTIKDFESEYSLLTGSEVLQILHQGIRWPESLNIGPIGVKTDAPLLTVLHARTYDDEALLKGRLPL